MRRLLAAITITIALTGTAVHAANTGSVSEPASAYASAARLTPPSQAVTVTTVTTVTTGVTTVVTTSPPPPARERWNQPVSAANPDLDCVDIGKKVRITGPDHHRLDADGDGWGCESYG